jgi:cytochrome P450
MNADELKRVADPRAYASRGYPWEVWEWLRRERPVAWIEPDDFPGFHALTRQEEIRWVSMRPQVFRNGPRLAVDVVPGRPSLIGMAEQLLDMDPPKHGQYRRVLARRFAAKPLERLRPVVEKHCDDVIERFEELARAGTEFEVVASPPIDPQEKTQALIEVGTQFAQYFTKLAEARRSDPHDDVVSDLNTARETGDVGLTEAEQLAYYALLIIGGGETTVSAISGGFRALVEHPDELRKLQRDPGLIPQAVEEILRWTSPIIHFCRTAMEDVEIAGTSIRTGEALALYYPSANRDEAVFDSPNEFRVDRKEREHLAFGISEHFCLGANLARLELRSLFERLVPRLDSGEILGVERVRGLCAGGFTSMNARARLRA